MPESCKIQPYYKDSDITIFNGDCGKVLPFVERADLLLTDAPQFPFGLNEENKQRMKEGHALAAQATRIGPLPERELLLAISKTRDAIVFNHMRYALPKAQVLLWYSKGCFITETCWTSDEKELETIRLISRGDLIGRAYFKVEPPEFRSTCRTLDWMSMLTDCIEDAPNGHTVLDPFMGDGDVMVAAIQLGRKFIGIEMQKARCQQAVDRITQIRKSGKKQEDSGKNFRGNAPRTAPAATLNPTFI